jgi:Spy/CpxP family protein refolding chaperone
MKVNHRKNLAMATIIALALISGLGHAALAQHEPGQGPGGGKMAKELNLTADQQAKIKQIMEANHTKMQAIRNDQSLTQEQRQQQMRALHESMKTQMDAVLTPDQQQKMAQMHEKHGGMGGPGMMGGNPGERMAKELNLTADQQTKMKAIMESTHQQMSAIEKDQSLSQQDKHAKIQQLHESTKSQISAILTPDQQQKFAQMHEHMGQGGRGRGHRPGGQGGEQGEGAQTPPPGN